MNKLLFPFFFFLQEDGDRITWDRSPDPFTTVINAPEKKSKFKGMKSFIAYNLIPSVSHENLNRVGIKSSVNVSQFC